MKKRCPRLGAAVGSALILSLALAPATHADDSKTLLDEFVDLLTPPSSQARQTALDAQLKEILTAFEPVVARAARSTVRILDGEEWIALGTVVDSRGGILTKASEIGARTVHCQLPDGSTLPAERGPGLPEYDLILLRVKAPSLQSAPLLPAAPILGSLVATPSPTGLPSGVGVVSVGVRDLSEQGKGYLGVGIVPRQEELVIRSVREGSAAARAGLREGDILISLDGQTGDSVQEFVERVAKLNPKKEVELRYERDGKHRTAAVVLGDRGDVHALFHPLRFMDLMGGPTSAHRSGYPQVWQHDIALNPKQMGGPVVDLDGNVLGINIARAGRVKTYAIPSAVVLDWLGATPDERLSSEKPQPVPGACSTLAPNRPTH